MAIPVPTPTIYIDKKTCIPCTFSHDLIINCSNWGLLVAAAVVVKVLWETTADQSTMVRCVPTFQHSPGSQSKHLYSSYCCWANLPKRKETWHYRDPVRFQTWRIDINSQQCKQIALYASRHGHLRNPLPTSSLWFNTTDRVIMKQNAINKPTVKCIHQLAFSVHKWLVFAMALGLWYLLLQPVHDEWPVNLSANWAKGESVSKINCRHSCHHTAIKFGHLPWAAVWADPWALPKSLLSAQWRVAWKATVRRS